MLFPLPFTPNFFIRTTLCILRDRCFPAHCLHPNSKISNLAHTAIQRAGLNSSKEFSKFAANHYRRFIFPCQQDPDLMEPDPVTQVMLPLYRRRMLLLLRLCVPMLPVVLAVILPVVLATLLHVSLVNNDPEDRALGTIKLP